MLKNSEIEGRRKSRIRAHGVVYASRFWASRTLRSFGILCRRQSAPRPSDRQRPGSGSSEFRGSLLGRSRLCKAWDALDMARWVHCAHQWFFLHAAACWVDVSTRNSNGGGGAYPRPSGGACSDSCQCRVAGTISNASLGWLDEVISSGVLRKGRKATSG
jgi:hypothetical protein